MLDRGRIYGRGHSTTGKHRYGRSVTRRRPCRQPGAEPTHGGRTRWQSYRPTAVECVLPTGARGCAAASAAVCAVASAAACAAASTSRFAQARPLAVGHVLGHAYLYTAGGREAVSTHVRAAVSAVCCVRTSRLAMRGLASAAGSLDRLRLQLSSRRGLCVARRAEWGGSARSGYAVCGVRAWCWAYGQHSAHL